MELVKLKSNFTDESVADVDAKVGIGDFCEYCKKKLENLELKA
jgi:predicted Zn-dependent protease